MLEFLAREGVASVHSVSILSTGGDAGRTSVLRKKWNDYWVEMRRSSTVSVRPRWNGHRPPFGDEGPRKKGEALQDRTASMCQSGVSRRPLEDRRAQMNATTYGLDIAKRVFQMY